MARVTDCLRKKKEDLRDLRNERVGPRKTELREKKIVVPERAEQRREKSSPRDDSVKRVITERSE